MSENKKHDCPLCGEPTDLPKGIPHNHCIAEEACRSEMADDKASEHAKDAAQSDQSRGGNEGGDYHLVPDDAGTDEEWEKDFATLVLRKRKQLNSANAPVTVPQSPTNGVRHGHTTQRSIHLGDMASETACWF